MSFLKWNVTTLSAVLLLTSSSLAQDPGTENAAATSNAVESTQETHNWAHWRGPRMNGHAYQTNLPADWTPDGENLVWRKEELASRGTPVVMNGKMYIVCRAFPETTSEGEKTVCFDPKTGEIIWESIHNVFLSDAPAERVSWISPVCDPETNQVYVLGINGVFQCLNGDTGEIVWEHSMMEEYGMISPYGGRTNLATVFGDLVIVSSVMTGWGDTAVPAHRFVAFDKYTGVAAWFNTTRARPEDTTYSTPVFTVLNGQAVMVVGAADGAIYGFQPRTGKTVFKYQASPRGINTTPLVDEDGIVYCGHAEQNESDRTVLGALFAFDGKQTGDITEDKLLWKVPSMTVSRCAPLKVGDRLYVVEDGGKFVVLNAKTGEEIYSKKVGRAVFSSLVYGDGKIYCCEAGGRTYIFKPTEDGAEMLSNVRLKDESEFFGSPVVHDGRVYLPSIVALYCVGSAESQSTYEPLPPLPKETPKKASDPVAHIQVAPVELMLRPGQTIKLQVRAFNERGQFLKLLSDAEVSVEGVGEINDGVYHAPNSDQAEAVFIKAKSGELTSTARIRIIPELPIKEDFASGKVPLTWIGAAYRHQPAEIDGGEKGLVKISTIPKGTRSQAWFAWPDMHDYTVQADFFATNKAGGSETSRLPDMGLIAQRYTLDLMGPQQLQIRSWTPRLENRFAKTIPFTWEQQKWYRMKFQCATEGKAATLRGKVWLRDEEEPAEWQIEATDAVGNLSGSPGMFGNSGDAEFYIDNILVTPNK